MRYLVCVILLTLFLHAPAPRETSEAWHQARRSPVIRAVNNAKDIYNGLRDFRDSYGSFPSIESAPKVCNDELPPLETADQFLRMLFDAGIVMDEMPFYVSLPVERSPYRDGDGDISQPDKSLEEGENVFSYSPSTKFYARRPLMITMLGEANGKVGVVDCFNRKLVVLRHDGSVDSLVVHHDGKVGDDPYSLLDARHPDWGNEPMDIRLPAVTMKPYIATKRLSYGQKRTLRTILYFGGGVLLVWWIARINRKKPEEVECS